MASALHQVEDITAEVDEREEYSDEYERSQNDESPQLQQSDGIMSRYGSSIREADDEEDLPGGQNEAQSEGRAEDGPAMQAPVVIQEVLRVQTSSQDSRESRKASSSFHSYDAQSPKDTQEVVFREVYMPQQSAQEAVKNLRQTPSKVKALKMRAK